ncbi:RNA polymerase subunit sigma-24 [Ktedonobacter sp. SOSP1-85]|uniref:RNA polymerase sigma factor n=1 Tax=Ktedonobacter sp. SOSP1-85 TaxID=2778367 RepID=UPI001915DA54|nr:sigma-70 family RNA polymerase sigma factor [Ktedonobacter sp. SOSP1-85]GHO80155.1 RNA polymerase subunit sigma-24 [Ktedonobacter sp. SOSP1-85]
MGQAHFPLATGTNTKKIHYHKGVLTLRDGHMGYPLEVYTNEKELLAGLQRQEKMACTCLVKHFARRLFQLARRFVESEEEAHDVLQESFIQACRHISTFQAKSSLSTWLYRIVVNSAHMHHRRKQVSPLPLPEEQDDGSTASLFAMGMGEADTPDEHVLRNELRLAIQDAVAALPDTLREAFVLRHIEGLSTAAAAKRLGIEQSALKVRLYRARQELRNMLISYTRDETDS